MIYQDAWKKKKITKPDNSKCGQEQREMETLNITGDGGDVKEGAATVGNHLAIPQKAVSIVM